MADAALVGTISSCPKCQSMVQINPPAETQATEPPQDAQSQQDARSPQVALGAASVDSEAITEDGISGSLSGRNLGQTDGNAPLSTSDQISPGDQAERGFANTPPASDQPTLVGPPPAWQDDTGWQSSQTRRTRHIVMIATLAISTLCLTILLFGWFVRSQKQSVSQVAKVQESAMDVDVDSVHDNPAEMELVQPSPETPEIDDSEVEAPEIPEAPGISDEVAEEKTPQQVEPASETSTSEPETAIPASLMPKSPIDDGPSSSSATEALDEDAPTLQELPAGLRKFTPFLLQDGPIDDATLSTPLTIEQVEIDAAAEEDASTLGIDPPAPINIKKDLGGKILLNSPGYPLPSLVLLMSQMTGVPIQLDWVSFDLAGVDIDKRIKVVGEARTKARTVRQWLDAIADQVSAEVREEEFLIVITITDKTFAAKEAELTGLTDFGDQAKSAATVIKDFMSEDEKQPSQMGPREASQLKILATEMLRRMRTIEPKLADRQASRWIQTKSGEFLDWKILQGNQAGKQVDTPITTAAMLRQVSSANQAVCLVNWFDANRRGMRPNRLVMPYAGSGDASMMLSSVLSSLSLQVRSVDDKHWWVGSVATYDRLPVLVRSEPLGDRREAYARQIDGIMGVANRDGLSHRVRSRQRQNADAFTKIRRKAVAKGLEKFGTEVVEVK